MKTYNQIKCGCDKVLYPYLVVQREKGDGGVDSFSALGTNPDHLQASLVDLVGQLVYSDVTRSTHQHLAAGR